jgi:hypothetical protein
MKKGEKNSTLKIKCSRKTKKFYRYLGAKTIAIKVQDIWKKLSFTGSHMGTKIATQRRGRMDKKRERRN